MSSIIKRIRIYWCNTFDMSRVRFGHRLIKRHSMALRLFARIPGQDPSVCALLPRRTTPFTLMRFISHVHNCYGDWLNLLIVTNLTSRITANFHVETWSSTNAERTPTAFDATPLDKVPVRQLSNRKHVN